MINFSPVILVLILISLIGLITLSNVSIAANANNQEKPANSLAQGLVRVNGGAVQSEQIGNSSNWQGVRVLTQSTPKGIDGQSITLNMQNGKASGFSGCNTFTSNYTLKDQSLKFDTFIASRRACVDDNLMALERKFLKAIATVDGYKLNNGNLLLTAQNAPVIEMKVI